MAKLIHSNSQIIKDKSEQILYDNPEYPTVKDVIDKLLDTNLSAKGVWVSDAQYIKNDFVSYAGSGYICLDNNTNTIPSTSPLYWGKYIDKGDTGDTGEVGPKGDPGEGIVPGSDITTGNILPSASGTKDIGSPTLRFRGIYVDEAYLSANSLYVNGKKVLEDVSNTITVSTDVDQNVQLKTTGAGLIQLVSNSNVTITPSGGTQITVPSTYNSKDINLENYSSGGNITCTATGVNGEVQFYSNKEINFTAPVVDVPGGFRLSGVKNASALKTDINGTLGSVTLATVATSGSYNDLTNKPSVSGTKIEFGDVVQGYGAVIASSANVIINALDETDDYSYVSVDKTGITLLNSNDGTRELILNGSGLNYNSRVVCTGITWESPITVNTARALTISKHHIITNLSSPADYTVTLPAASTCSGKLISIEIASSVTKLITIDANASELIDGSLTRVMWASETAILLSTGTGWTKIAGKSIPMVSQIRLTNGNTQTINITTTTVVQLDQTDYDVTGMMADPANRGIIIKRTGNYSASGYIYYFTFGTSVARVIANIAGSSSGTFANDERALASTQDGNILIGTISKLTASETIKMNIYSAVGGKSISCPNAILYPHLNITELVSW